MPSNMGSNSQKLIDRWATIEYCRHYATTISEIQMPFVLQPLPNSHEPYYRFLYLMAAMTEGCQALELGVYLGTGLAHLAMGADYAIGVDNEKHDWDENLKPFYNCRIEIADSIEFLENDLTPNFDLIHIDTIHEPDHVNKELELALKRLKPGGVICIDDVLLNDEMMAWWKDLDLTRNVYKDLHVTGFGIITA